MESIDPRVVAYLKEHCGPHCYGEQDENGIDLSLIRSNLELTPLERIRRHDACLRDVLRLQKIGRERNAIPIRADR